MHRSTSILLAGTLGVGIGLIGPGASKATKTSHVGLGKNEGFGLLGHVEYKF